MENLGIVLFFALGILGIVAIWIVVMFWRRTKEPKLTVISSDKDMFRPRYLWKDE